MDGWRILYFCIFLAMPELDAVKILPFQPLCMTFACHIQYLNKKLHLSAPELPPHPHQILGPTVVS